MQKTTRTCRDCGTFLRWIQVYDQGAAGLYGGYPGIIYSAMDARPSIWMGVRSVSKGTLQAAMCPDCSLVSWYALSQEEWEQIKEQYKIDSKQGGVSTAELSTPEGALSTHPDADAPETGEGNGSLRCLECDAPMEITQERCAHCGWSYLS